MTTKEKTKSSKEKSNKLVASNATNILLRHNYIAIPQPDGTASDEAIATIMMNLSYYGFALNVEVHCAMAQLSNDSLATWWKEVETELKSITGDDRKIGDFVVYKNFPAEVLEKSMAEYWIPQIMMYWGFPNEFFTQEVKPREKMAEQPKATVLKKTKTNTLKDVFSSYLRSPARWKEQDLQDVLFLSESLPVNLAKLSFKENLVQLASFMMANNRPINISTATDVLRLAAGLSDGDVSLREHKKFISFKKPVRRFLLSTLENCGNLTEDVARRPELWKRLLHQLHPGDYKRQFPKTVKVADDLYNDRLTTYNSKVEVMLSNKDPKALDLLSERPGDFRRRLIHTLDVFGDQAMNAFISPTVLDKLNTAQVVSLRTYLETVNDRYYRVFPPKGNWNKIQIGAPRAVKEHHIKTIANALGKVLQTRVPKVKVLDDATTLIKLPNNGEVSSYSRGTVFPIPDGVDFIRTASYWGIERTGNIWFDNGWNFFDSNWKSIGACCWDEPKFGDGAAVFSGDPTNSKEMKGRAAQLIDLYPEQLKGYGVRYAVWNVLCFSNIPFSEADDVFAALQWGKNAQTGKLFEPSRCQLSFQLTSDQKTKYVCMIDLLAKEMVFLDANLPGKVSSATSNGDILEKNMPAFMEYIKSLPSVHDLFRESIDKSGSDIHVLYSDKDTELKNVPAYVFKPESKTNKYKSVDLNTLLT